MGRPGVLKGEVAAALRCWGHGSFRSRIRACEEGVQR